MRGSVKRDSVVRSWEGYIMERFRGIGDELGFQDMRLMLKNIVHRIENRNLSTQAKTPTLTSRLVYIITRLAAQTPSRLSQPTVFVSRKE